MESAVCKMCGGKGDVFRPERKVSHMVWRRDETGDFVLEEETTIIGGIDACPVCAVAAEVDWITGARLQNT